MKVTSSSSSSSCSNNNSNNNNNNNNDYNNLNEKLNWLQIQIEELLYKVECCNSNQIILSNNNNNNESENESNNNNNRNNNNLLQHHRIIDDKKWISKRRRQFVETKDIKPAAVILTRSILQFLAPGPVSEKDLRVSTSNRCKDLGVKISGESIDVFTVCNVLQAIGVLEDATINPPPTTTTTTTTTANTPTNTVNTTNSSVSNTTNTSKESSSSSNLFSNNMNNIQDDDNNIINSSSISSQLGNVLLSPTSSLLPSSSSSSSVLTHNNNNNNTSATSVHNSITPTPNIPPSNFDDIPISNQFASEFIRSSTPILPISFEFSTPVHSNDSSIIPTNSNSISNSTLDTNQHQTISLTKVEDIKDIKNEVLPLNDESNSLLISNQRSTSPNTLLNNSSSIPSNTTSSNNPNNSSSIPFRSYGSQVENALTIRWERQLRDYLKDLRNRKISHIVGRDNYHHGVSRGGSQRGNSNNNNNNNSTSLSNTQKLLGSTNHNNSNSSNNNENNNNLYTSLIPTSSSSLSSTSTLISSLSNINSNTSTTQNVTLPNNLITIIPHFSSQDDEDEDDDEMGLSNNSQSLTPPTTPVGIAVPSSSSSNSLTISLPSSSPHHNKQPPTATTTSTTPKDSNNGNNNNIVVNSSSSSSSYVFSIPKIVAPPPPSSSTISQSINSTGVMSPTSLSSIPTNSNNNNNSNNNQGNTTLNKEKKLVVRRFTGSTRGGWAFPSPSPNAQNELGISPYDVFINPQESLSKWSSACYEESKAEEIEECLLRNIAAKCGITLPLEPFRVGTHYLEHDYRVPITKTRSGSITQITGDQPIGNRPRSSSKSSASSNNTNNSNGKDKDKDSNKDLKDTYNNSNNSNKDSKDSKDSILLTRDVSGGSIGGSTFNYNKDNKDGNNNTGLKSNSISSSYNTAVINSSLNITNTLSSSNQNSNNISDLSYLSPYSSNINENKKLSNISHVSNTGGIYDDTGAHTAASLIEKAKKNQSNRSKHSLSTITSVISSSTSSTIKKTKSTDDSSSFSFSDASILNSNLNNVMSSPRITSTPISSSHFIVDPPSSRKRSRSGSSLFSTLSTTGANSTVGQSNRPYCPIMFLYDSLYRSSDSIITDQSAGPDVCPITGRLSLTDIIINTRPVPWNDIAKQFTILQIDEMNDHIMTPTSTSSSSFLFSQQQNQGDEINNQKLTKSNTQYTPTGHNLNGSIGTWVDVLIQSDEEKDDNLTTSSTQTIKSFNSNDELKGKEKKLKKKSSSSLSLSSLNDENYVGDDRKFKRLQRQNSTSSITSTYLHNNEDEKKIYRQEFRRVSFADVLAPSFREISTFEDIYWNSHSKKKKSIDENEDNNEDENNSDEIEDIEDISDEAVGRRHEETLRRMREKWAQIQELKDSLKRVPSTSVAVSTSTLSTFPHSLSLDSQKHHSSSTPRQSSTPSSSTKLNQKSLSTGHDKGITNTNTPTSSSSSSQNNNLGNTMNQKKSNNSSNNVSNNIVTNNSNNSTSIILENTPGVIPFKKTRGRHTHQSEGSSDRVQISSPVQSLRNRRGSRSLSSIDTTNVSEQSNLLSSTTPTTTTTMTTPITITPVSTSSLATPSRASNSKKRSLPETTPVLENQSNESNTKQNHSNSELQEEQQLQSLQQPRKRGRPPKYLNTPKSPSTTPISTPTSSKISKKNKKKDVLKPESSTDPIDEINNSNNSGDDRSLMNTPVSSVDIINSVSEDIVSDDTSQLPLDNSDLLSISTSNHSPHSHLLVDGGNSNDDNSTTVLCDKVDLISDHNHNNNNDNNNNNGSNDHGNENENNEIDNKKNNNNDNDKNNKSIGTNLNNLELILQKVSNDNYS